MRRYGSRGSTIATNDDYDQRLMGLLDTLTMFSPLKPAAESLLYAEDYPVTPFATPKDRFDNLMEDPQYQGLLADAGMAGQGLPVTAPAIVIGTKAKNFPKALAEKFEQVEAEQLRGRNLPWYKGYANKKGWEQTGVYRGPDGKLRYEIDDSAATFEPVPNRGADGSIIDYQLQEPLSHKELYENYEDLAEMPLNSDVSWGYAGVYRRPNYRRNESIAIADEYFDKPEEARDILLHELQHAVQNREGFTGGGNLARSRDDFEQSYLSRLGSLDREKIVDYEIVSDELSNLRKLDRINYLRRLENSNKPQTRLLTRLSDFGIDNRVSDQIGPMPKRYGQARYDWVRNGARVLRNRAEAELYSKVGDGSYADELFSLLDNPKKLKSDIGKLSRKQEKLRPAAVAEMELDRWIDTLRPMSDEELYRRLGGEAEARMVQKRKDYTPEERAARFPLDDYDVPLSELIIKSLLD